ncbi:hypothetical protein ACN38_g6935 [Penicillium nordicum]|uniref:Major facilitator superfamily (MFS) profile domain-containing protein n=1 Tax=Penicillium nordicum TaxID=229535 RepID=A0A0M8P7A5_9EURO|nr:hypothetical protein ACN38_g6935 [Penicillium nordicum]
MANIESDTVEPVPPGILGTQGIDANGHAQDEESPLLQRPDIEPNLKPLTGVGTIIAVLLLGEFISNADATLVMAAAGRISSEFNRLRDASWLSTGYTLGLCAAQPMYGKLSDISGRKPMLLISYLLFAVGCIMRLFILQAPFLALAAALVIVKLNVTERPQPTSKGSKLAKVDFLGTALLGSSVIAMTTLVDQGGKSFPWSSWWTVLLASGGVSLLIAFVLVEAYVAREPIFNLRILRRTNVAIAYIIGALQITAQLGLMFSVPLYFQVTQRASTTAAGVHLIPAVVGNTLGGLLAGIFIRHTGQFKILLVLAGLVAGISYLLLYLRWDGHSGFWQSLFILPGGLGTGIAGASSFIAMSAMLPAEEIAMATAGYMLIVGFSMTAGVTTSNSVLGMEFQRQLRLNVHGPGSEEVIQRAMADTNYIAHLTGQLREIVVACYISGLRHTYLVSLGCSLLASFGGLFIARHQI